MVYRSNRGRSRTSVGPAGRSSCSCCWWLNWCCPCFQLLHLLLPLLQCCPCCCSCCCCPCCPCCCCCCCCCCCGCCCCFCPKDITGPEEKMKRGHETWNSVAESRWCARLQDGPDRCHVRDERVAGRCWLLVNYLEVLKTLGRWPSFGQLLSIDGLQLNLCNMIDRKSLLNEASTKKNKRNKWIQMQ